MSTIGKGTKMCNVTVFLFGKPSWEMNLEGQDADEEMVRAIASLADELNERLNFASAMTRKLIENGWTGQGGLYDIWLYKEQSLEQTEDELTKLGIDLRGVDIHEEEWPLEE
jgi:hypothetical protein